MTQVIDCAAQYSQLCQEAARISKKIYETRVQNTLAFIAKAKPHTRSVAIQRAFQEFVQAVERTPANRFKINGLMEDIYELFECEA